MSAKKLNYEGKTRETIQRAIDILREYGATKIILFGSRAEGREAVGSDIDLACEGIPAALFFHVVGKLLCELSTSFDLVDINDTGGLLRENIAKGIILYEREK